MAAGPSILDQLKQTGGSVLDAIKSRYLSGPPQGAPSAGPGSVLDQKNTQLQQLAPFAPQQSILTPQQALPLKPDPTAQYGTRPGEQRIDVSEYQRPLGGLSGVKRK